MIEPEAFAAIRIATDALDERAEVYGQAQRYYDGDHHLPYATERWLNVYGRVFHRLRDNMCKLVVNALIARLKIDGFGVEASAADLSLTAPGEPGVARDRDDAGRLGQAGRQRADDIWSYNRMDATQLDVHRTAVIKGDAYVIVWPDAAGRAGIYANEPELCYVEYDPELPREVLWAVKRWIEPVAVGGGDSERIRVNLYYPDRIEKYISVGKDDPKDPSGWSPYDVPQVLEDPETGEFVEGFEPWPLPNPYGRVPVFHFRNAGRQGGCGESELADVIPLQDALNKAVMDLMVTAETLGYPQRYLTGLQPEIDEATGEPKPLGFKPGQDQFWSAWGDALSFGQFAAAELTGLVALVNDLRTEIGRLSQTPPHLMFMTTGEIPSGEALKVVEAPFTAKVTERQTVFGNAWEDVESFAALVDTDAAIDVQLSAEWRDAQPVSELERAQRAQILKTLGLPDRWIWRRVLGLSDIECDELERLKLRQLEQMAAAAPDVAPGMPSTPGVTPPALAASAAAAQQAAANGQEGRR